MNKLLSLFLSLSLLLSLTACGAKAAPAESESIELTVFAAASLTETLDAIAVQYKEIAPDVTLVFNYDSSGTLLTQIEEGAQCDLFLSAAQKQMDTLEEEGGIDPATRKDLLENKVTLCVPEGNPAAVTADSAHAEAAKAFLEYLSGEDCAAVFETVGFTALS